ncbi:MAG: serine protease [Planctomycetota bacterium]|nr:serine protease [Planctomycetota bacterium]
MKKKFAYLAIIVAFILALSHARRVLGQPPSVSPSSPALADADQPHPAVARIRSLESNATSFGTGTLIYRQGNQGILVTNDHVIRDAQDDILVTFPNGFRSSAKVIIRDPRWDLAALLIWSPEIDPVVITGQPAKPGDRLTIAGYGSGRYRSVSGICSQYVSPGANLPHEMVELRAVARNGDSGGPIFNQKGELAGVLFGAGWRSTSGSYSGRVQKFLNPVIQRMQSTQTSQAKKSATVTAPAAKITGLNLEDAAGQQDIEPVDVYTEPAEPEYTLPSNELLSELQKSPQPNELELPPTEAATPSTPEKEDRTGPSSKEVTVVHDESVPRDPEKTNDVGLLDDSLLSQNVSVSIAQQAGQPTTTANPIPSEPVDEPLLSAAQDAPQSGVLPLNETMAESTVQPDTVDQTEVSLSENQEDPNQILGWKELAGDTLLKQIRSILAGIGFLVIVIQLARRRQ